MHITAKWLPTNVDLPARRLIKLAGIAQSLKSALPDIQEVLEGESSATESLNVDDTTGIMCMEPIEA